MLNINKMMENRTIKSFRKREMIKLQEFKISLIGYSKGTIPEQESLANFARRNSRPARGRTNARRESSNERTCGISRKNENYKLSQCAIDVSNARTCTIHKRYCN